MAATKAMRKGQAPTGNQQRAEAKQYFLSDEALAVFTDELFEYAHELEALWTRLKQEQPTGDAEIDGIADFETKLFVLRTRCDTIQWQLDKLSRRLPEEDEAEVQQIVEEVDAELKAFWAAYVPLEEAAKKVGLDMHTLRREIRRGSFPAVKLKQKWYTTREWLEAYLSHPQRRPT